MPSIKATIVSLIPLVGYAQAAPTAEQLQKRQVDAKQICENYRPAPNELGIMALTGVQPAWSGSNLGLTDTERWAAMYNSDCEILDEMEWGDREDGQRGWEAKMVLEYEHSTGQVDEVPFFHHSFSIGAALGMGEIYTTIHGENMEMFCNDEQSDLNGLTADVYRSCNFDPKPYWPTG